MAGVRRLWGVPLGRVAAVVVVGRAAWRPSLVLPFPCDVGLYGVGVGCPVGLSPVPRLSCVPGGLVVQHSAHASRPDNTCAALCHWAGLCLQLDLDALDRQVKEKAEKRLAEEEEALRECECALVSFVCGVV